MELFGLNRSIQYIERELDNVEFAKTKEDIRSHGANTMILTENILKELLHIYGYILLGKNYELDIRTVINLDEKVMFGTALSALNKFHRFLKDVNIRRTWETYFNRTYIIFRYNDEYFDKLMQCSKIRAKLLHDILEDTDTIDTYKGNTIMGIKKSLDTLKHFKQNEIFPDIISLSRYYYDNSTLVCEFINEIGAKIPVDILNGDINKIKESSWYLFKGTKSNLIIPTFNRLNQLSDIEDKNVKKIIVEQSSSEETTVPSGYLLVNYGKKRIPIIDNNITIGRLESNDLVFNRRSVSRRHCMLKVNQFKVYLIDFNSKYGTLLNGTRINPEKEYELRPNDEILIGLGIDEIKMTYHV